MLPVCSDEFNTWITFWNENKKLLAWIKIINSNTGSKKFRIDSLDNQRQADSSYHKS